MKHDEMREKKFEMMLYDMHGYQYVLTDKISEGGQGAVYLTNEDGIVVKLAFDNNKNIMNSNTLSAQEIQKHNENFFRLLTLPLPMHTNITLPVSTLKDAVGYTMRFMEDMISFEKRFSVNGTGESKTGYTNEWLETTFEDIRTRISFADYIGTGGVRGRLHAYYLCACILAKIHAQGLVYCDFSDNNVFITKESDSYEQDHVWLIDADNLNYQEKTMKPDSSYYTPKYNAPEIPVGGGCTFYSDCHAFAVSLFWSLTMRHPFQGEAYYDEESPEEADLKIVNGEYPFVLDEENPDNALDDMSAFFAKNVLHPTLLPLFMQTFTEGMKTIRKRSSMLDWAEHLAIALDNTLVCTHCGMPYYNPENPCMCSWCDTAHTLLHVTGMLENGHILGEYTREVVKGKRFSIPWRIIRGTHIFSPDAMLLEIQYDGQLLKITSLIEDDRFVLHTAEGKIISGRYETIQKNLNLSLRDIQHDKNYEIGVELV